MIKKAILIFVGLIAYNCAYANDGYDLINGPLTTLFSIIVGGGVGYAIRYAFTPKGVPANSIELGFSWFGYIAFIVGVVFFSKFAWKQDVDSFMLWLINLVIWGLFAFVFGWLYGVFIKFANSDVVNTNKISPSKLGSETQMNKGNIVKSTKFSKEMPPPSVSINIPINAQDYRAVEENNLYEIVANEIETGSVQKGLWTRLYAECGGDETQVKVKYIQERVANLKNLEWESQQHNSLSKKEVKDFSKELERERLLNLIFPETFQLIKELETFRENHPNSNEVESLIVFIGLIGGYVTSKQEILTGTNYTVDIWTSQYKFHRKFHNANDFNKWFYNELVPKVKTAEDFPLEKLQLMELHGMTFNDNKYKFLEYSYNDFDDALRYAKFWADKVITTSL